MTTLPTPSYLGDGTQTFNSTAPYTVSGGTLYYYNSLNTRIQNFLVVTQRSSSDSSPPGSPTIMHTSYGMSSLAKSISIPTSNRFKIDLYVFKHTVGSDLTGNFIVVPHANSVAGGAVYLYFQNTRSIEPVRTWTSAYTNAIDGSNNGPYGSTNPSVPIQGYAGKNTVPSTVDTRVLMVAVSDGAVSLASGAGYTNLSSVGGAAQGALTVVGYSAAGGAAAKAVNGGTGFTVIGGFEVANDTYADNIYYGPYLTPFSATETLLADDRVDATGPPSYRIYRDGVLIGTSTTTSFTDTTVTADGMYNYTVSTVSPSGAESPRTTAYYRAFVDVTPTDAPTSVSTSRIGNSVTVSWSGVTW